MSNILVLCFFPKKSHSTIETYFTMLEPLVAYLWHRVQGNVSRKVRVEVLVRQRLFI